MEVFDPAWRAASLAGAADSSEMRRRLVHVGMGIFALAVVSFWQTLLMGLSGLVLAWVLPKWMPSLLRPHEQAQGYSVGVIAYPAAVVVLTLLFPKDLWIVAGGWAMMAYGDGMAVVCGQGIRGPKLWWNPRKSLFGTLGFILFGWLGTLVTVLVVGGHPFTPLGLALVILAAAGVAALLESLPYDICDNPLVAGSAAGVLFLATQLDWAAWQAAQSGVLARLPLALALAVILGLAARATKSVDWSGALTGAGFALILYATLGWLGVGGLMAFFIVGTVASKIGYEKKRAKRTAQEIRTWRNAVANAGVAALCAPLVVLTPHAGLFTVAVLGSFAAAASDTVAGEIGRVYGGVPYSITTWRRAQIGDNGAVSVIGLLAGWLTALGFGALAYAAADANVHRAVWCIAIGGMGGNLIDSLLGATAENAGYLDNEAVNFACTLCGALLAVLLFAL
ncbi:DUF92 domain-containing protein [Chloracidobacterium sp. MS 40/45]|jgi:uncharacterized protein (TIGR00297 family)|uniref:DUF92 domain-containing protein n=1 Tax=Chloracidobacterium aggregatum TaxID=2851959 RepID=UPI001B8ADC98|nr:DUF92 domain-containing protein [Chloracidobacterium aggregatum]QUV99745.1 DUF92 domain-containing protein [Chloracidobacterium sp. MS 40/45]